MSHLDEAQLAALFDDELEPEMKRAAEAHLAECAECRALWDETRDLAREADRLIGTLEPPPLGRPKPVIVATTPSPVAPPRRRLPWRTLAWAASVLAAVGLGYSMRSAARDTTDMAQAPTANQPVLAERADKVVAAPGAAGAATTAESRNDLAPAAGNVQAGKSAAPAAPAPSASAAPAPTPSAAPAMDAVAEPTAGGSVALSQADREARPTRALAAQKRAAPREVSMEEAVRTLAGSIRLVDGLAPVRVLAIAGSIVPSTGPDQEIVRVVYDDPPGRELWLDQQRPAAAPETARARPSEALLPGDTLLGPAEGGARSLRWIDQNGFLLRLTGYLPGDSLRALVPRVH